MKPPKCKTCGAEAWSHICGGLPQAKARVAEISKAAVIAKPKTAAVAPTKAIVAAAKFDRAAYMRDRHEKRKANQALNPSSEG